MDPPSSIAFGMESIQWSDREFGILAGSVLFEDNDDANLDDQAECDPFAFWSNNTNKQYDDGESRLVSPTLHLEGLITPTSGEPCFDFPAQSSEWNAVLNIPVTSTQCFDFPPQSSEWNAILYFPATSVPSPPTQIRQESEILKTGTTVVSPMSMISEHETVTTAYITASTSSLCSLVKPKRSSEVQSEHRHKLIALSGAPLLPRSGIPCSGTYMQSAGAVTGAQAPSVTLNSGNFVPISPSTSMSSHAQSLEQLASVMAPFSRPVFASSLSNRNASSAAASVTSNSTNEEIPMENGHINNNIVDGTITVTKKRKYSCDPQRDEEMEEKHRKERNRFMAKRTRDKKKLTFSHLKDALFELAQENKMLKGLVQNHSLFRTPQHRQAILNGCTAMERIPQQVWDMCESESHGDDTQKEVATMDILHSSTTACSTGCPNLFSLPNGAPAPIFDRTRLILPKRTVPNPLHL